MEDATGNAAGFSNGASTSNEYTYDVNGNLTKDSNKGIASISYNSLNLPSVVTFSDGSTITYLYTADGRKLRTTHVINGTTTTTDYCGNVIYEGTTPKKLLTDEGYVDLTTNTYYYYLKDHQGNNRVVINADGGDAVEVNHYYPFGSLFSTSTNVQPYKYNGKELDTKKGLNWYDYGARHYDAVLGRFTTVDPLAEKYYPTSIYAYCINNPVRLIDSDGRKIVDANGNVIYTRANGWTANAPADAIRIGEAMMNTRIGTTQFYKMVDAEHNITLNISSESKIIKENEGNTIVKQGRAKKYHNKEGKLISVDIIIYEGSFTNFINANADKSKIYKNVVKNNDDIIGATATHESVHATDNENINNSYENEKKGTNHDVEKKPVQVELHYLKELFNIYNPL